MTIAAGPAEHVPHHATHTVAWRLPRWARPLLLTVHITASVGWLGVDGAVVGLEIARRTTHDTVGALGVNTAIATLAWWGLVPMVAVSLLTGLALSASTVWGLFRYWWIVGKVIAVFVLTITGAVAVSLHAPTLAPRALALLCLLAATTLSVFKPWGRTRHGKQVFAAARAERAVWEHTVHPGTAPRHRRDVPRVTPRVLDAGVPPAAAPHQTDDQQHQSDDGHDDAHDVADGAQRVGQQAVDGDQHHPDDEHDQSVEPRHESPPTAELPA